jgi:hypothetical protein
VTVADYLIIAQYNAWCLNQGEHYTAKRGSVNWNAELIWKMRSELGIQWDLLQEEIPTVFETLLQSLSTCLTKLQSQLRGKIMQISRSRYSFANKPMTHRKGLFIHSSRRHRLQAPRLNIQVWVGTAGICKRNQVRQRQMNVYEKELYG